MKLISIKKSFKIFTNLKFAIFILILIAIFSSFGSFIEQDESVNFYKSNYPQVSPIYGFITWKFIVGLGIDHIYRTWWFLALLLLLGISLLSCTITRQFPVFLISKEYFFKKEKNSFFNLPFFVRIKNLYYIKENLLLKLQKMNFYIYQKNNILYGYKGLIGRISPILVHFSLIIVLTGGTFGAFKNFKAQELLPKGELFHIQNPIGVGWLTNIPNVNIRVNDFWVEYENKKVHQFYSNLSILDNFGDEKIEQTISVNNPLKYKNIDIYQSDWNLIGIRIKNVNNKKVFELPIFQLKNNSKSWISWIPESPSLYQKENSEIITNKKRFKTLIFDQLENTFTIYDNQGKYMNQQNIYDAIDNEISVIEIIPSTGLLIKYDPSIPLIYLGFGLLMITSLLSFLPYTQIWIFHKAESSWLGGSTNRGKIQLEIEFENLIRYTENLIFKSEFLLKK